jgi:hypothetical protein
MLLITIFVELRVVAREADRGQVAHKPSLDGRAVPWPWEERHCQSMAWARHGHGMAGVNQTRPHCVNQMGKTRSKPLAARHGRGTAWARHALCESAFRVPGPGWFQCDEDIDKTNPNHQHKMYSFLAPELGWHDLDFQSLLLEDDGTAACVARNSMIFCGRECNFAELGMFRCLQDMICSLVTTLMVPQE